MEKKKIVFMIDNILMIFLRRKNLRKCIQHLGLGQNPPTKSPPIMKSTSYLYIGIFAHILDLLYCYLLVNITFEYYFS
jgi:hypothetical protein